MKYFLEKYIIDGKLPAPHLLYFQNFLSLQNVFKTAIIPYQGELAGDVLYGLQCIAGLVMTAVLGHVMQNWAIFSDFAALDLGPRIGLLAGLVGLGAVIFGAVCFVGGALRDVRALRDPVRLHRRP